MKNQKNIILIGMPASGKSTVGVILAKKIGYSFLDTDVYIQTALKKLLPEIIESSGISEFCKIEEKQVLTISEESHIIATGGSVVYGKEAMKHLKTDGIIVYLKTSPKILSSRIADPDQRGVIRKPGQTIDSLFEERHPLYSLHADIVIDCDTLKSPVDTANKILQVL